VRVQPDGFGARAGGVEGPAGVSAEAAGLHAVRAVCALAMVCPVEVLDALVHSSLLVHVLMDSVRVL
jgi:hypothetical protein